MVHVAMYKGQSVAVKICKLIITNFIKFIN